MAMEKASNPLNNIVILWAKHIASDIYPRWLRNMYLAGNWLRSFRLCDRCWRWWFSDRSPFGWQRHVSLLKFGFRCLNGLRKPALSVANHINQLLVGFLRHLCCDIL